MSAHKSFRMIMTQQRRDLFNEFFEMDEFKNVKVQTKLIESVFNAYKKLRRENARIKLTILKLSD